MDPREWSSTALQVGGFAGASAVHNEEGTVTFTIDNTAGTKSFFYHRMPDLDLTVGPLHMKSVHQRFQWTELIDGSKCKCPEKYPEN